MPSNPKKLILVYSGDSGLATMIVDVVKKSIGREDCPLCEITYTPVGKRASWVACTKRLDIEVEETHRDRVPPEWNLSASDLPCVLAEPETGHPRVLLSRDVIVACRGSVEALEKELAAALELYGARSQSGTAAAEGHAEP